jgi:hypothetical protein
MSKTKDMYSGRFNYSREIFLMYRYAFTERQAWKMFCEELAGKHNIRVGAVMNLFDGSKDNFEIKNETQFTEVDND